MKESTSKVVLSQKIAVWGLVADIFKDFTGKEFDGSLVYKNEFGKPFYRKDNICFSITHSKDLVGVAFSNFNVGLDIERVDLNRVNDKLISRVLTNNEIKDFSKNNFFDLWTKKEAVFKLKGDEKSFIPKNIDINNFVVDNFSVSYNDDIYSLAVASYDPQDVQLMLLGNITKL